MFCALLCVEATIKLGSIWLTYSRDKYAVKTVFMWLPCFSPSPPPLFWKPHLGGIYSFTVICCQFPNKAVKPSERRQIYSAKNVNFEKRVIRTKDIDNIFSDGCTLDVAHHSRVVCVSVITKAWFWNYLFDSPRYSNVHPISHSCINHLILAAQKNKAKQSKKPPKS